MERYTVQVAVGAFVALGMLALLVLAMKVSNLGDIGIGSRDAFAISARFANVGGLKVQSQVSMAGVRIGRVTGIEFDDQTYEAVVTMSISSRYDRIPADSSASIFTAGLLGEQYVGIEAGGEEQYLGQGDQITLTQSAVILEQLIGQLIYNRASESN